MSDLASPDQGKDFDDFLLKIGTITRADAPESWTLQADGLHHFERLYAYAYFLYTKKCYDQSKQLLTFLSLSNPLDFKTELGIGLCAQKLGLFAEAIARFGKAMLLNPEDPRPIYFSAQIFEIIEEWQQAWIFFDHAYKLALGNAVMSQILIHAQAGCDHCQQYL